MKRDKALLLIKRQGREWSLLDWTVERISSVTDRVMLQDGGVGHRTARALTSGTDGPGRGPASGILGAARDLPRQALLVLAHDLPNVPVPVLRHLVHVFLSTNADWVLPRIEGRLHPLCAIYGPRTLEALAASVEQGNFGLWSLYRNCTLNRLVLESRAFESFGDPQHLFSNVNTPEDYEHARTEL